MRLWNEAYQSEEALLNHQFLYRLLRSGELAGSYQGDTQHSWLLAAAECNFRCTFLVGKIPRWATSLLLGARKGN